jgi:hypothetical protein
MVKLTPVRQTDDFGEAISRNTFDENGFANARWKFDEQGFMKARVNALDAVRSQMINATHAENQKIIKANNPSAFSREVDGVDDAPDDAIKP